MTCVVGLVTPKGVHMGADSLSGNTGTWHVHQERTPKVFRLPATRTHGELLIGFTSSWRMGQLLRWKLSVPDHATETDAHEWLATRFVDAVRECLKAGGFASKDKEVEEGGVFLIGYSGRLFRIDTDYQVGEPGEPHVAIGCGMDYAVGALHATAGTDLKPSARLTAALEAAAYYSAYVRPPFLLLSQPEVTDE